jgi:hypothetical protein
MASRPPSNRQRPRRPHRTRHLLLPPLRRRAPRRHRPPLHRRLPGRRRPRPLRRRRRTARLRRRNLGIPRRLRRRRQRLRLRGLHRRRLLPQRSRSTVHRPPRRHRLRRRDPLPRKAPGLRPARRVRSRPRRPAPHPLRLRLRRLRPPHHRLNCNAAPAPPPVRPRLARRRQMGHRRPAVPVPHRAANVPALRRVHPRPAPPRRTGWRPTDRRLLAGRPVHHPPAVVPAGPVACRRLNPVERPRVARPDCRQARSLRRSGRLHQPRPSRFRRLRRRRKPWLRSRPVQRRKVRATWVTSAASAARCRKADAP